MGDVESGCVDVAEIGDWGGEILPRREVEFTRLLSAFKRSAPATAKTITLALARHSYRAISCSALGLSQPDHRGNALFR